ncbi:MAG TPA: hypothetical protein VD971_05855 [Phycisphaerales bacterium]|nr:hypothetical protein [Phycisphaerales bacterium]
MHDDTDQPPGPCYPLARPPLRLTDAASVIDAFRAGAAANRDAPCRRASVDDIRPPGRLIATGDLHDNPVNFAKLLMLAGMTLNEESLGEVAAPPGPVCHLTLHEIIHSDRLFQGMDMSYRALARVADLKARYPGHVHTLLGNHELAQLMNAAIVKDGVRSVDAFNDGVEFAFGDDATAVLGAVRDFIRSMPIALEVHTTRGTILCAHSVPAAAAMGRFDASILSRDLTDDDYQPRTGSAYLMTWGRGYDHEGLEDLVERWGAYLFILGHEKAEDGVKFVPPNAIILASDHDRGAYLAIDLEKPPTPEQALEGVAWFAGVG